MKQKGIVSYGIANNRQNPLAGTFHDAIFNTWRRFYGQVFYWAPPVVAAYYIMNWAIERYAHVTIWDGWVAVGKLELTRFTGTSTSTQRQVALSLRILRSRRWILESVC